MTDLEAVRKRWLDEKPIYEEFGKEIKLRLEAALRRAGIWAQVNSRPKEVDSLIRKLITKPHHDYESVGDKSGVRVVVRYKSEVDAVLALAAQLFDCGNVQNKADTLGLNKVGYLSVHVDDVRLRETDPLAADYLPAQYRAELQVRTLAQNLWSEMAHPIYKNDEDLSPLSDQLKRRINLLAGVVEMADNEFDRLNSDMPNIPELKLLKSLQRHYYKITTRPSDPGVSREIIRLLAPLYKRDMQEIAAHLDEFYARNEGAIRDIYDQAEEDPDRPAYLYQPEALMIYDRLLADTTGVRKALNALLPESELERLALAFGISLA